MGECGPGPEFISPKQCKSDRRVKIHNSVSARSPLKKSKREKILERAALPQQYKKRVCVSAMTGSVPHKMVKARQRV